MSIFERLLPAVAGGVLGVVLVAAAHCGGSSASCLQFSDCADGLTCSMGVCVPPPPPGDAGEDGSIASDSSTALSVDAATTDAADAADASGVSDAGAASGLGDATSD